MRFLMQRVVLVCLVTVTASACLPPPGTGRKADRGYARAAPVLSALEGFHAARGAYPDSLVELVPEFLNDASLEVPARNQERYPLSYQRESTGFRLEFQYVGPGMNRCAWTSEFRARKCRGNF